MMMKMLPLLESWGGNKQKKEDTRGKATKEYGLPHSVLLLLL
jgi:hypothetical protein